ncbi:hypothetical protein [Actinobacillus capsulatus]|uniref:hypothetical protein n=1 Tax=Actinobacillus capsulatus TaxID=717 RepID=UPI0003668C85|nr:hypothetical protein [Actinobacillus capsulatus]
MKRFSKDSKINNLAFSLLKIGWKYRKGKKHNVLISPNNKRIAIPSTPSDCKAFLNFNRSINHLIQIT